VTYVNLSRERMAAVGDLIPAIARLRDEALRDAALRTWCLAWEQSGYDDLRDVPDAPGRNRGPLLTHVNLVNDRIADVIGISERDFGVSVDYEVALCAAILHDVDKPLLWEVDGDVSRMIVGRTPLDHGEIGARLARSCGVPERIIGIVLGHSLYNDHVAERRSPEAVVLFHADMLSSTFAALADGHVPYSGRVRTVACP
jgi:putative nucleotidyltransferase with HDIG domain